MANKKQFSIETIFKMIDRATAPIKAIGRQTRKFSNIVKRSFKGARIAALKFTKVLKRRTLGALKRVAQFSFAALAIGIGLAVRSFVSFDKAITGTVAKFGGINLASEKGIKVFNELKKAARAVGAATEFTATQAAEGLEFLAMAGFNAKQAMSALPEVVDLATVANIDFARAVDISSDVLGAFNLNTKDSVQLQKNLGRVNDVLAKTVTSVNTNMEDLFEGIKAGGADFIGAGQSMETFNALIGTLSANSVKGSRAGTILKNVVLRLGKDTGIGAKRLKKLGVSVADSSGNFRDLIDILADVEKATKKMGTRQRSAALDVIFGARAITGMNILLAQGSDKLMAFRNSLINAGGTAQDMAEIMRMSILNKLKTLISALTEVSFVFIEAFSEDGKDAIEQLTAAVKKINMDKFVKTLKTDVFPVLKAFWNFLKIIGNVIEFIVKAVDKLVKAIMSIANIASFGGLDRAFRKIVELSNPPVVALSKAERFANGVAGDNEERPPVRVRSPEASMQRSISETTEKNELIIRGETDRAELVEERPGQSGITLLPSGAT